MTTYTDKTLKCKECDQEFAFTAREQEFYAQKGFTNAPGRCPDCRTARKARQESTGGMGVRTSGGYSWGSGGSEYRGGRGGETREYHTATCSSCGKEARVPFVPRGDKPVYCSDCYRKVQTSYR